VKDVFFTGAQYGRGARIRTEGPLVPNQVRYQTALHPEREPCLIWIGTKRTIFRSMLSTRRVFCCCGVLYVTRFDPKYSPSYAAGSLG
jgi:hypothetical protein